MSQIHKKTNKLFQTKKQFLFFLLGILLINLFQCATPGERATEYAYKHENDKLRSIVLDEKDPNLRNDYGWTPLMSAAEAGNLPAVTFLLNKKASPNLRNQNGDTALIRASVTGKLEIFKLIEEKGGSIHLKNHKGYSCLMKASERGQLDIIKYLISKGVDVNEPILAGKDSTTALHLAAKEGMTNALKLLISAGGNFNVQDSRGFTPLMAAIEKQKPETVDYLLSLNPNTNVKSYYGDTIQTLLEEFPQKTVSKLEKEK